MGAALNQVINFDRLAIYVNPSDSWAWEIFLPSGFFLIMLKDVRIFHTSILLAWLGLLPWYFILIKAIVKSVRSQISFSVHLSLSLGCRRATDFFFYELISYQTISLEVFISWSSLVVLLLVSFMYTILSSTNKNTFISPF